MRFHAHRNIRFLAGFLMTFSAGLALLCFSPYASDRYLIPAAGIYVDSYQHDAMLPDLDHGISPLADAVRAADVLIIGSSKALFGISAQILNERFRQEGLRFFNLGIGGGEGAAAASRIIDRLDLRRKVLLVNLDDSMVSEIRKPRLVDAVRLDWFQAATRVVSVRLAAIGDTFLDHLGLPQLSVDARGIALSERAVSRTYRDAVTGDAISATRAGLQPAGQLRLPPAPAGAMLATGLLQRPRLRGIVEEWKSRGMQLVFLAIPYGTGDAATNNYNPALAAEAARLYGGEHVDLDWRSAVSIDGIHVDRETRRMLSENLAEQLADPTRGFAARALLLRNSVLGAD